MGDEREGRRRCLMGAGPLLGQLHCLPSVEAARRQKRSASGQTCRLTDKRQYSLFFYIFIIEQIYTVQYSPCVGAEAVKGQTGSKE